MEICMQQHAPLICINRETTQSSRERPNTMISREDDEDGEETEFECGAWNYPSILHKMKQLSSKSSQGASLFFFIFIFFLSIILNHATTLLGPKAATKRCKEEMRVFESRLVWPFSSVSRQLELHSV